MRYDEALRVWGAKRLEDYRSEFRAGQATMTYYRASDDDRLGAEPYDPATVMVTMSFDKGYACCGGTNPDCYCSQATSPTAEVTIEGRTGDRFFRSMTIDLEDFDFVTVLGEICDAAGGTMTGNPAPVAPLPWPPGEEPQL